MTFHQLRPNRGGGYPREERRFNGVFSPDWIKTGITQETVRFSDDLGKFIKETGLTTSQIRNVFGEIKRIQLKGFENEKPSFYLLKPKMAYASKRAGNICIQTLKQFFDEAHSHVNDKVSYQNFVDFFESILAYHKAYGGKD